MTILFVNKFADADIVAIYEYLQEKAGWKIVADYDLRFQTLFARLIQFPESGPLRLFSENTPVSPSSTPMSQSIDTTAASTRSKS